MPKIAKELSAIEVKRLRPPGNGRGRMVAVGGVPGLYMQLLASGGRTWILRASVGGRMRDIGLGGFPEVPLTQARERAREAKDKIRRGTDPVEERKAAKAALVAARKRGLTFTEAFDIYDTAKLTPLKDRKGEVAAIDNHAKPHIGDLLVQDITVQDVLRVLEPIWTDTPVIANAVRIRLAAFFKWALGTERRTGDNPAAWELLEQRLPAQAHKTKPRPALPVADAPAWFAELRKREGMGSRALEFLALTAARSGEVRGATWDELHDLDGDSPMWIIPPVRMKMDREHRVPLSPAAVELLDALPRFEGNPRVSAIATLPEITEPARPEN